MSVTSPTLTSDPAAGFAGLAAAGFGAAADITSAAASNIAARGFLVISGTPPRTWTGRMLRDVRMPRIVSAADPRESRPLLCWCDVRQSHAALRGALGRVDDGPRGGLADHRPRHRDRVPVGAG